MIRLCIFALCAWFVGAADDDKHAYGLINFCSVQYVNPGDDFVLECKTDHGAASRIYLPREEVPPNEEILEDHEYNSASGRTITLQETDNADYPDAGFYTCVVIHGPGVFDDDGTPTLISQATCEVIMIRDPCEGADCGAGGTCIADNAAGTYECSCDFECWTEPFEALCTDTCEFYWSTCMMNEASCLDKKPRSVAYLGYCEDRVVPNVSQLNEGNVELLVVQAGETILLASGLLTDGTPGVSVSWMFFPKNVSLPIVELDAALDGYTFAADATTAGDYEVTIMQCQNADEAIVNRYFVDVEAPLLEDAPGKAHHVCSLLPGGVVEAFSGDAGFYDLACTHVLAGDVLPGGDSSKAWLVYGAFDEEEGDTSLSVMSFYMGSTSFDIQRGWIVNVEGTKLRLEEGVAQQVGDSECSVVFENLHLNLDCPYFEAYYDGLMAGHIRMTGGASEEALVTGRWNVGLCFDNDAGYRTNWQIGKTSDECLLSGATPGCAEQDPGCDIEVRSLADGATCGVGAGAACNQLSCGDDVPTSAQACSLARADRVSCALKSGGSIAGEDGSCPQDSCDWMVDVVARWCPQEYPPYQDICV